MGKLNDEEAMAKTTVMGAILATGVMLAGMTTAWAQGGPPPQGSYEPDAFGLASAGVYSGPYIKAGGGWSWSGSNKFDDTPVYGGGIGWRFTPYFRMDATFDYRSDNRDRPAGNARFTNWAAMVNAYLDFNLPIIRPLVPYIGGGIGIDQNKVNGSIATVSGTTTSHLTGSSKNQFAWQAMAGVSYYFTPNLALDVGYRYFYGGRAESGSSSGLPVKGDYSANEIIGSLRWGF